MKRRERLGAIVGIRFEFGTRRPAVTLFAVASVKKFFLQSIPTFLTIDLLNRIYVLFGVINFIARM